MRSADSQRVRIRKDGRRRIGIIVAVLAVALALTAALVSGCGPGNSESTSTTVATGSSTSESATTTSGSSSQGITLQSDTRPGAGTVDHITWNLPGGEPPTLDPLKSGDYQDEWLCSQIYDSLIRFSSNWDLNPSIAESWKQVDPSTLVFTIRQDVKFWDGNPLTADDVVFSLTRQMDPSSGAIWTGLFASVASIEKTGPWEVTVKFSKPNELFVKEMGTTAGDVVEKAYVEKAGKDYGSGTNIMGSGPYKVVSWTSGSNIELQANADYWDANLKPKVQAVTLEFLVDTSTIMSALMSGELDGMYETPVSAIPALQTATSGKLYYGPGLIMSAIAPVSADGPMGNANIRKALSIAIDRQMIVDKVFHGAAIIDKTITPPTAWDPGAVETYQQAYAELPGDKPDLATAKSLVAAEAGASKPMVLAYAAGNQDMLEMVSIVQQAAKDIGLTVELKPLQALDYSNFFYMPEYRKGVDMILTLGFMSIPDPMDFLPMIVGPYAIFNWLDWKGADADAAWSKLDQAGQEFDPTARANLVIAAQKIYTAATISIPLTSDDELLFMNSRLSGAPVSFAYLYMPDLAMLGGTK